MLPQLSHLNLILEFPNLKQIHSQNNFLSVQFKNNVHIISRSSIVTIIITIILQAIDFHYL